MRKIIIEDVDMMTDDEQFDLEEQLRKMRIEYSVVESQG